MLFFFLENFLLKIGSQLGRKKLNKVCVYCYIILRTQSIIFEWLNHTGPVSLSPLGWRKGLSEVFLMVALLIQLTQCLKKKPLFCLFR